MLVLSKNIYQKARDKPCGHLPSSDVYITPCGKKLTFISCTHNFPYHTLLRRQNTQNSHKYLRVNKEPGNTRSNISTSTRPEPVHYQNMFSIPDPNSPDISKSPTGSTVYIGLEQTLFWPT